jgi:hypothetical protein
MGSLWQLSCGDQHEGYQLMNCDECQHLSGLFLESMIFADKAEVALRAYFLTHQREASVSELAEYSSLKNEQQRTVN